MQQLLQPKHVARSHEKNGLFQRNKASCRERANRHDQVQEQDNTTPSCRAHTVVLLGVRERPAHHGVRPSCLSRAPPALTLTDPSLWGPLAPLLCSLQSCLSFKTWSKQHLSVLISHNMEIHTSSFMLLLQCVQKTYLCLNILQKNIIFF